MKAYETDRGFVDLNAPDDVRWIARKLGQSGYQAWAVGGSVRDRLAGLEPGDWDLTTSAPPNQVRRIFRRTVPIGIEHGTVGVISRSGRMYEVTTFRRDVETFGRHARVVFADTLEEDLDRRDFTINAVAWNPITGELRDPHGGVEDLTDRLLRTVGEPTCRFEEDRLRVLRALRFAGTFDLEIDGKTWLAIQESADQLGNLSSERIREELRKVLTDQRDPTRSLQLYGESGVLRFLYPELEACRRSAAYEGATLWELSLRTTSALAPGRFALRLAALLHLLGEVPSDPASETTALEEVVPRPLDHGARAARSAALARDVTQRLRCSNAETDLVTHMIAHHKPLPGPNAGSGELRRWIRLIGPDQLNDLFRLLFAQARAYTENGERRADVLGLWGRTRRILSEKPPLTLAELAIGGAELRALGIRPGPRYREILEALLDLVLEDPSLNDKDVLVHKAGELAGLYPESPR